MASKVERDANKARQQAFKDRQEGERGLKLLRVWVPKRLHSDIKAGIREYVAHVRGKV